MTNLVKYFDIYDIIILGGVTICFYLYFVVLKKIDSIKPFSKFVEYSIIILFMLGVLIKYSQFLGDDLGLENYFEIVQTGVVLSSFGVGITLLYYFISLPGILRHNSLMKNLEKQKSEQTDRSYDK